MKWPADRIAHCSPKSFGMYEKARPLEAGGRKFIHLEVGRPNFDTPQHIKDATKKALDDGIVHYGEFPGDTELRKAIVGRLNRDIVQALAQPAMIAALNARGLDPAGSTPEQFDRLIRSEIEKWTQLVRAARIKVE